jgi:FMN phosphatase YigB (HAD superfamily)
MTNLTLLLDLDDTLLTNNIETFIPNYLKVLSGHMASYVDPLKFASQLLKATGTMIANERPDQTLSTIFDSSFYPVLGIDPQESQSEIENFYNTVFPTLKSLTAPRPQAVELVEEAFEREYKVAIATNPLFPSIAINQRLDWANLPVDKYNFSIVSSYDSFHYAKPNPAYYAEILAQTGWTEGAVVMVGNDAKDDIAAARSLGLAAFHVASQQPSDPPIGKPLWATGELADVIPWIDSHPLKDLEPAFNTPTALVALLKSTPAALDTILRRIDSKHWTKRPNPGEWSLTEILCHLRDIEAEINLPRIEGMLADDNYTITGQDVKHWASERKYIKQDGFQAFQSFVNTRIRVIDLLGELSPEKWHQTAHHTVFSHTTFQELVSFITRHDRLHIQQIFQILDSK